MGTGPVEVQAASEAALVQLAGAFATSQVTGSVAEWAGAVGSLQQVIDAASAAQDAAIVRLAAIEPEWLEDGTLVQGHRALGHVALDAPAVVSGVLACSAVHAERRVRTAVRLAVDGPAGTESETGLGGLHAAMATGQLDQYRAAVVADELDQAPPAVAATVVAALEAHFGSEDGTHLRRRCRRALARISPDLLVQRARRAREQCGLRRWVEEPGVDRWEGTFPSEDAAQAWAAIDALAHQYVKDGVCASIERARAQALTDLVAGNATIETVLTVTVPATALDAGPPTTMAAENGAAAMLSESGITRRPSGGPADEATSPASELGGFSAAAASPTGTTRTSTSGDLVEATGFSAGQPVLVSRQWLTAAVDAGSSVQIAPCHPVTGALLDPSHTASHNTLDPSDTASHNTLDPSDTASHDTLDPSDTASHNTLDPSDTASHDTLDPSDTASHDTLDPSDTASHDDLGADDHTGNGSARSPAPDPVAGVLAAGFGVDGYRPTAAIARRIRARDRRCRFPGCSVAAVFCDLDHVRPWPNGPTRDDNLLTVCRRHHRVKQRPGWTVTLTPDGVATFTDPTGRTRTTQPVDALHTTVLTGATTPATPSAHQPNTSRARTVIPDGPHSELEFLLEHLIAAPPGRRRAPASSWRDGLGRRHRTDLLPPRRAFVLGASGHWPHRRTRHPDRSNESDLPPF